MSFTAENWFFFQLCVALKKLIKGDGVDIQQEASTIKLGSLRKTQNL